MIFALSILSQARLPEIAPEFLTSWLGVFILLGGLVLLILTIVEKLKAKKPTSTVISPDPLRTQKVPELVTRDEIAGKLSRVEKDIDELKVESQEIAAAQEDRIVKLHERVNKAVESLDFVRGVVEGIQRNQEMIMAKLLK